MWRRDNIPTHHIFSCLSFLWNSLNEIHHFVLSIFPFTSLKALFLRATPILMLSYIFHGSFFVYCFVWVTFVNEIHLFYFSSLWNSLIEIHHIILSIFPYQYTSLYAPFLLVMLNYEADRWTQCHLHIMYFSWFFLHIFLHLSELCWSNSLVLFFFLCEIRWSKFVTYFVYFSIHISVYMLSSCELRQLWCWLP